MARIEMVGGCIKVRAFCICLPEDEAGSNKARAHFAEMGVENVEFFWGINATVAGLATSHTFELDHPNSGFRMGCKPTGIWLSHYMLWSHLMRLNDDRFMVLETDAQFRPDWKVRLGQALNDVPSNFDFLHPGHCCMEGHPRTHVAGEVYESKHAQCTHAYIVRRGCLPFVLRTLRKCHGPIDIQLQLECFPKLLTYAIMPRIVDQFNTVLPP